MKKLKVQVAWNGQYYWQGFHNETNNMEDLSARKVAAMTFESGKVATIGAWTAMPICLEDIIDNKNIEDYL